MNSCWSLRLVLFQSGERTVGEGPADGERDSAPDGDPHSEGALLYFNIQVTVTLLSPNGQLVAQ